MAKQPQAPVPGNAVPKQPKVIGERKYARMVRARARGYYGQMREEGEVFENTLDLSTYPEKATSWIEAVEGAPAPEEESSEA
ncbi:hypothetical protein EJP67_18600 [Variovorax guangxiensis]|uniref:Uncharacterized protein n=1 Tax=Variovorax guangxiensis TaxID=1775474 RepID=A0A3S0ZG15_9BURK|nr:hypothetical protein [Variovorax guangxiensis]RUR69072.1 hypothetical protein EJP67_18600 [Variovorax guangxiensis]